MGSNDDEERLLQSVALANAQSILKARQSAEKELIEAKDSLERKTEQLAQSLSLVRATLESTADGIFATSESGRVTEFNATFIELWGLSAEMLRAADMNLVFEAVAEHLRDPDAFNEILCEILASSPEEQLDVLHLADGRVVEQFTRIQEIEHRVVGRVWSYRDITERARVEAALRDAKEAAEAANRAKSDFLAMMSHELRTPLNAIGGYVELLEMGIRGPVTKQQCEDLHRIKRSQRHLLGLINEVLNYAKIETGTVHYELSDVPIGETLANAEGLMGPQVWKNGITLTILACPEEVTARADVEKLQQILLNLLSNAVKFTGKGGEITLACLDAGDQVVISVEDTGRGIPAERLGSIFEPFVQIRSELTRTQEGAGLGLAISRDLARGMGGELTVESIEGQGSIFILKLPAGGAS